MTTKDYAYLEGKLVTFPALNPRNNIGKVVGCDYDIGISIISNSQDDDYFYCLVGQSSPLWDKIKESWTDEQYKIIFTSVVTQIEQGVFDEIIHLGTLESTFDVRVGGRNPMAKDCSFGQ